jgi:hypothetical protein
MSIEKPERSLDECLKAKVWTVEETINVLAIIQFQKQGKVTFADVGYISKVFGKCTEFIQTGIDGGHLHPVDDKLLIDKIENIASGVAGGIGLGTLISSSTRVMSMLPGVVIGAGSGVAPFLITGSIAHAAFKLLSPKYKNKKFLQQQLIPSEVVEYAKLRGLWLCADVQPSPEICHSPSTNVIDANLILPQENSELDLMAKAKALTEEANKGKRKSDSLQAKNAAGPRPHIYYAKVQATYHALLNMRKGCMCISRDLKEIVYNEIHEDVTDKYKKINKEMLKNNYVKDAVNVAMRSDHEAATRIYKGTYWDNKWLKIPCTQHD